MIIPYKGRPFHEVAERSAEILVAEEGLKEALSRLSCLPISFPQVIRTNFAELSIERRKALLTEFYRDWASPIAKLHLVELAFHCPEDTEILPGFIKKTIDSLYDNADGLHCYNMFKVVLLWVNNELSYSSGSKEWPAEIKLSIIWAHAGMLHHIFKVSGAPQDEMANIFEARYYMIGSEILDRNLLLWGDVLHPLRISRSKLIVHGLLKILREDGRQFVDQADIITKIKDYISMDSEEGVLPEFFMFNDPVLLRDGTESMLGGDRGAYSDILGSEISQQVSSTNLKTIVRSSIEALLIDICQPQEWLKIYSIVGDLPLYEDLSGQFASLLKRSDLHMMINKSPLSALLAMRVFARQAVYSADDQLKPWLENALLQLATFFAGSKGDKALIKDASILKEETIAVSLLEDVLNIALRPNTPRETSREFSRLLGKVFEIWPVTMQQLENSLFRLAQELPAEQLHGLWPLIFKCRAKRK